MLTPTRFLRASYSSTLRLPKSPFPPRPLPDKTPLYLQRCTDDLYAWQRTRAAAKAFTLHDGPPYANGPLHIGHALNKITKDIICRFHVTRGERVSYIPGWDCHGLPIEIKALQAAKKSFANTDAISIRTAARELAAATVESQKQGFKEWGVMGDWQNAYQTMEKQFELRQLEVFREMWEKGLVYRQFKPVYWSPSSRTALAEAELEYDEGHKSLAAFVRFPATVTDELKGKLKAEGVAGEINVVIWTTTPWTLPANKAIAVHRDMEYCVVKDTEKEGELTLVAATRVAGYEKVLERKLERVVSGLRGSDLAGNLQYENPFQKANGLQPVIHADFVTDSSGTGLVHFAPGHGMDDYHVCQAMGIQAFAPIDDAGAFTKEAFPERPELLEGLLVSDEKRTGTRAVCDYLEKQGFLRAKQNYRHKYPIDWRTKQPVVVRATEQWFADVGDLKDASMKAIADVNFLPETGRFRLESFIQGRSQWCISRQRAWGVPIPALYKVQGDTLEATMDSETIQHLIKTIRERGIDAWWTDAPSDPAWTPPHLANTGTYIRGRDTMDVWFDSGTSWTLLPESQNAPVADVYLEGTDQHRGWFQSSLLTYIATQNYSSGTARAPYKTLITHGFTLDSDGRKMSKSLGNVISPSQIMSGELLPPIKRKKQKGQPAPPPNASPTYDGMGADALRLWAASSDYMRDVTIGQPVLQSVNQALHKYRVTFKWLLGVLSLPSCPPQFTSFDSLRSQLPTSPLLTDTLALHRLSQVSADVHSYYTRYEFFKALNTVNRYIATDLSAFYFETLKDRIYTGHLSDCQTLQAHLGLIFYELLQILAPIAPLLVEEVWDHVPAALRAQSSHPARAAWEPLPATRTTTKSTHDALDTALERLSTLSSAVKAAQERLRADKHIGSGLETAATLVMHPDAIPDFHAQLQTCLSSTNTNPTTTTDTDTDTDTDTETDTRPDMPAQLAGLLVISDFTVSAALPEEKAWPWSATEALSPTTADALFADAKVVVHPPALDKCPRCWRFARESDEALCNRCDEVVGRVALSG
ncbi:Isoleucine--tRNA ligase [Ascochyta rabiei]|uniref:Isoleucine--tRNA ligase, mitochondrial n=1 Tax=Didymella rabiei TaxID=5454 RepID=A0A162XY35_DIDRA|nr:Isoleucine--tRNA ligase [Ascochyta rabiei]KZM19735.1 aminoacyl-tRNA editing [Ascochyta rabiei]UPX13762.1 Isoleucine--tRNA ligase [Ascochyta rabiei]